MTSHDIGSVDYFMYMRMYNVNKDSVLHLSSYSVGLLCLLLYILGITMWKL